MSVSVDILQPSPHSPGTSRALGGGEAGEGGPALSSAAGGGGFLFSLEVRSYSEPNLPVYILIITQIIKKTGVQRNF